MKQIAILNNEYTETYEDYILSELVASFGQKLMFLDPRVVEVDGEKVLVADPTIAVGKSVKRLEGLWSRNCVTPQDEDSLESFNAVDAIVRFGTHTDDKTGEVTVSVLPKIICLLDQDNKPLRMHGEKQSFREK